MPTPRLLITLGDVAGIGPEIVVKAWPSLVELCRPIVVGDVSWLRSGPETRRLARHDCTDCPCRRG